jgi:hypothetical protein
MPVTDSVGKIACCLLPAVVALVLWVETAAAQSQKGLLAEVTVTPAPAQVRINDMVNLKLSFVVAAGEKEQVAVQEIRTLSCAQNALPNYPVISERIRSRGSYTTGFSQKIPPVAAAGTYRYEVQLCAAKIAGSRLPIRAQPVTPAMAEALGLAEATGAIVSEVKAGAAERAAVKVGDVIVKIDGQTVRSTSDLPALIARTPATKTVRIKVLSVAGRWTSL